MKEIKKDLKKFGNINIYNPWSILNYIDNKELKAYWVNTSSNVVIKENFSYNIIWRTSNC